jgi:hypothetical protein
MKGKEPPEDLGADGRIILKIDLVKIGLKDEEWIYMAQDTDR